MTATPSGAASTTLWRGLRVLERRDGDDVRFALRRADLRIAADRIVAIGDLAPEVGERLCEGDDRIALPGFVQGHVHFCQTLFRGLADDLPLLEWLSQRIWPLEAAHDEESIRVSAELTLHELLGGGTTAVMGFETVRHTEHTFAACREVGMTAILGNCLMDTGVSGPSAALASSSREAMRISTELADAFDGRDRLAYAVTPRFVLSVTEELAHEAAAFAHARGLRIHTHACEHQAELALVRARFHREYLDVLAAQGMLGPRTSLAHCVHVDPAGRERIAASGARVLHCPNANQKLGSGIAPIYDYDERGIPIALGADGAPCNNRLCALDEARSAARLQAMSIGPGRWPAARALHSITAGGAEALELPDCGRIEVGSRADLVLLRPADPDHGAELDVASMVVYAVGRESIDVVLLGGREVVRDGRSLVFDSRDLAERAARTRARLLSRAGLSR
jgi:5-methylthioadenosine/S-adenosylhomocysteine deaminase